MKIPARPNLFATMMSIVNASLALFTRRRPDEMTLQKQVHATLPRLPNNRLAKMHREIKKSSVCKDGKYKKAFVHPSIWHHPDAIAARQAEKDKHEGGLFGG